MKQTIERGKHRILRGILAVISILLSLLLLNLLAERVLAPWLGGKVALFSFWGLGLVIALVVLRVFVMGFQYELTHDVLRLSRMYGKRERHIEDIYISKVLFAGAPQLAEQKYPKTKRITACYSKRQEHVLAIAYKTVDGTRIAYFSPNEVLKNKLLERIKK